MGMPFRGRNRLIAALDAAVAASDTVTTVRALRSALCDAIRNDAIELPACVFEPCGDHYARRELYRSPERGYAVIAMTWGPSQGTPIHDHAGLWCVEGVWQGALEVRQYELLEHAGERFHFVPVGAIQAVAGSAGSLIPPHEHHAIRNASDTDIAISVHVYQDAMTHCSVFEPVGEDWYAREVHQLQLDAVAAAEAY